MSTRSQLWSGLSNAFQALFWVSGFVWLGIAGESGSPLPNNWRVLLFWSHVAEASALLALVASAICGVVLWARDSRVPVVGIISFALLMLTGRFWWRQLVPYML